MVSSLAPRAAVAIVVELPMRSGVTTLGESHLL